MEEKYSEEKYPIVSQPKRINVSLYKHQLTSIYNMEKLEEKKKIKICNFEDIESRVGILSDLTGYGKTLSILGLIERDNLKFEDGPFLVVNYYGNNLIRRKKASIYETLNTNLIVVNPSLFTQWENELKKTGLRYGLINLKKQVDEIEPEEFEVVLCNSNMIGYVTARFRNLAWKRLIIDEPLSFKITDYNNFAFNFIWLVTATPLELINRKKGINHIFVELFNEDEELLKSVIIKNPDAYVKSSFNMPENIHIQYTCYNPISKLLHGLVSPIIFEMIEAGSIKEAIKMLGGESKNMISLYDLIKDKKIEKIKDLDKQLSIKEEGDSKEKLKILERKNNLVQQVNELEKRFDEKLKESCVICNDGLEKPVFLPCCQNIMCGKCILTWLRKSEKCPLCRSEINAENLIYIQKESQEVECVVTMTKPQTILQILKSKREGKFIIFSNYDESFNSVQKMLDEEEIKYLELKGNKDLRNKNIQSYKNGEITVLFLNSKNNAAGINLEETTDIILYHQMTEHCEVQILGRANRIGRKDRLFVHNLN